MKTSIAIVDYGMGNLRSVAQALRKAAPEADGVGKREHRWLPGFAVQPDTVSDGRSRAAGRRRDRGRSCSCQGRALRAPAWYPGRRHMVPGEDAGR